MDSNEVRYEKALVHIREMAFGFGSIDTKEIDRILKQNGIDPDYIDSLYECGL